MTHPKATPVAAPCPTCESEQIACPHCGYADCAFCGNWDVGGADEGCLFCNQCNGEFS